MKREYEINLNNINDLKNFIHEMTYHIASDVDAIYDRQVMDAKSLLGLISISTHPIKVIIHSDDLSEIAYFKSVCEKYEVR